MAKQIKRSEIAEKDLYKNIRDSAEQTIEFVEYLNESLRETAQVLNKQLKQHLLTLTGTQLMFHLLTLMNGSSRLLENFG